MIFRTTLGEETHTVEFVDGQVRLDGQLLTVNWEWIGADVLSLIVDGKSYDLRLAQEENTISVLQGGQRYDCVVEDKRVADLKKRAGISDAAVGPAVVKATMPGLVLSVAIEPGSQVEKGDRLLIIEAMKMENEIKSPKSGAVISVNVSKGQAVEQGKILVEID